VRILLANPNTSESVTARIAAAARLAASPGTEIIPVTAKSGVPYIVTRAEAAIAAVATLELMAAHAAGCDAAVVAAFGDPGLEAARELLPIPIMGLAEASVLSACALGRRFSLICFLPDFIPWYHDSVARTGLLDRLASIRAATSAFKDLATVQDDLEPDLVELCRHAAETDGADVVILAGAPLAGLAPRIARSVPVPVIDGEMAAVRQAEALAGLCTYWPARRRPSDAATKPLTGVSDALRALFQTAPASPKMLAP
jgi:Asp/Glu/hydantoin racemase